VAGQQGSGVLTPAERSKPIRRDLQPARNVDDDGQNKPIPGLFWIRSLAESKRTVSRCSIASRMPAAAKLPAMDPNAPSQFIRADPGASGWRPIARHVQRDGIAGPDTHRRNVTREGPLACSRKAGMASKVNPV